ncbi:hypothetical protein BDW_02660 [Bdellovibrio bacteriovorus W]|nr:hypothetical protein BDW_02660 [Bdellovibrio bacteriovorus W]
MKAFFIALAAFAMLASSNASAYFDNSNPETAQVRPGPGRPGPYPGPGNPPRPNPGPRPTPRPTPVPAPRPNPGYPPPPNYRVQHVTCTSYNYRYNECYFSVYGVTNIRIVRQNSYDACVWGRSAGAYNNKVWVDRGCSATFEIVSHY